MGNVDDISFKTTLIRDVAEGGYISIVRLITLSEKGVEE